MVTFYDLEQIGNRLNGAPLKDRAAISDLLHLLTGRRPFLFELRADNGFKLSIGLADSHGCAQYSSRDGSPPYLMAVAGEPGNADQFTEFFAGGTPTPISHRFRLPMELIEQVAGDFATDGGRSVAVRWEEI